MGGSNLGLYESYQGRALPEPEAYVLAVVLVVLLGGPLYTTSSWPLCTFLTPFLRSRLLMFVPPFLGFPCVYRKKGAESCEALKPKTLAPNTNKISSMYNYICIYIYICANCVRGNPPRCGSWNQSPRVRK